MDNNPQINFTNQRLQTSPLLLKQILAKSRLGNLGSTDYSQLKKGIWIYFFLLIFEGALRKWILPGLATPLLIIRDPVAIWILVLANKRRLLVLNSYFLGFVVIATLAFVTAIFLGHGNFFVAIYGARIYVLHFPLIFIMGKVFTHDDVLKMGRVILYMAIPMTVLIAMQFYSPQDAWLNRGVGGEGSAGFDGANGYFRPPATFSFVVGTIGFYGLFASYLFYFWLNTKSIKKYILVVASVCMLAAIPLTISRSVFFEVVLSMIFAIIFISRKPQFLGKLIPVAIFSAIALTLLSKLDLFQTATEVFTARFDGANGQEGGLQGVFLDRFLGGLISALSSSSNIPFFGYGIGMGTNVGSMLLTGNAGFLIAEVEWGRMIGEMGAILGLAAVFVRVALSFEMLKKSFRQMIKGDTLPWMLLSFALLNVAQGQWAQPTVLGFSIISGGLVMAAVNNKAKTI